MKTEHLGGQVSYADLSSNLKRQILAKMKTTKEYVQVRCSFLQVKG